VRGVTARNSNHRYIDGAIDAHVDDDAPQRAGRLRQSAHHPYGTAMTSQARAHWENVYGTRRPEEVSWYRPHLDLSLELIARAAPDRHAAIIDVGGGEATLVDDLLARGYRNLYVLDIAQTALDVAQARVGEAARYVTWLRGDVTTYAFEPAGFDVWHDRAVFHFLTDAASRAAYVRQVARALKPGGHAIVATFGPEGPTKCSGLDVARYDPAQLHDQFGASFRLLEHRIELHHTPAGALQQFVYCWCRYA
jgi:SAM-dependent methyltransferase